MIGPGFAAAALGREFGIILVVVCVLIAAAFVAGALLF